MSSRILCTLTLVSVFTQSAFAARHDEVTPFADIKTQLTLRPGNTYLGFMKEHVKPGLDAYEDTIQNDSAMKSHNYSKLQQNLIAQGAGVAIRIDAHNYIFNIGYLDGSDPANDVKSGRSYGVGPTGLESDPSDVAYLSELEKFLTSEPQSTGDFVNAIMLVLTNCDTSGWAKLSNQGQIVATDFLAIYTAESDRHLMVNLSPKSHPWEIDLAAATFVSVFDAATGMIMQDGAFQKGSIQNWWAKGQTGSGIGNTRRDRLKLQKLIAKYDAEPALMNEGARLIGQSSSDDLIQDVLVWMNSTGSPLKMNAREAEELSGLMQRYLVHVQESADAILNAAANQ